MTIFGAFITPDGSGVTMWFVVGPMLLLYVIGMLILEERSRLSSKDINTACGLMSRDTSMFDRTKESCVCSTRLKHILTILTYHPLIEMSDNDKELESAQKDQKKIGKAESNPDTSGPTENLREEAAEMTDESQDSEEPA